MLKAILKAQFPRFLAIIGRHPYQQCALECRSSPHFLYWSDVYGLAGCAIPYVGYCL